LFEKYKLQIALKFQYRPESLYNVLTTQNIFQVALNLLSEREKEELVQLVDTMVSYSVTYKNTKFQPQERANVPVVAYDVPSLSFDPPINDIIKFKVH
jgi:chromosome transmission fidelity protein 18